MFYEYVKRKWEEGKVSIGLSADPSDTSVSLESTGLAWLALMFLSEKEKSMLAELSKLQVKEENTQPADKVHGPDPVVVNAVLNACFSYYNQYGFERLYLVGSRAKNCGRLDSDHDFVIVLGDHAPNVVVQDVGAFRNSGVTIVRNAATRVAPQYNTPDLVICRITDFLSRQNNSEEPGYKFPYRAVHEGVLVWSK